MTFAINGNEHDIRKIEMKAWKDGQWTHDFFQDMEEQFPMEHERTDGYDIICTEGEYNDLVEWWEQYCEDANNHRICDNGDDYTDYQEGSPEFFLIHE